MKEKDIFQLPTASDQITELKAGRNSVAPDATEYSKQLDPKQHDVMDPTIRKDKLVREAIEDDGIESEGETRVVTADGERTRMKVVPVVRIAVSLQKLIVKRAVAFTFGNDPILKAEPKDGTKEQEVYDSIKKVLLKCKTKSMNREIARAIFSTKEAAELWYVQEKPANYGFDSKFKIRVKVLNPLKGDKLYPYFDDNGDMIAFSWEYAIENKDKTKTTYFETYTETAHYRWKLVQGGSWELCEGFPAKNPIGKIPVVYGRQDFVEWEDVQNLINRLETLLSNFGDCVDYHSSPKLFVKGEIHGWAEKGEAGSVIEGDENSSVGYVSWDQAPEAVKLEIETLLRLIYTITQTPDVSFDSVKGLNVSGVALRLLFMDAHLKVMDKCEIFDEYLQRRISVIQSLLGALNIKDKAYKTATETLMVENEIVPFMIEDEQSKLNLLLAANGSKPIASRQTTIKRLGWVNNTEEELAKIEEEEGLQAMSSLLEQEPTM